MPRGPSNARGKILHVSTELYSVNIVRSFAPVKQAMYSAMETKPG